MVLVIAVSDMAGLADLYAIGVVGAIAANLGSSSTDKHLDLARWERGLMFTTFVVMAAIELSLFIDKPQCPGFCGQHSGHRLGSAQLRRRARGEEKDCSADRAPAVQTQVLPPFTLRPPLR